MSTQYTVENPFRNAVECYAGMALLTGALLVFFYPHYFLLAGIYLWVFEGFIVLFALFRFLQGFRIINFQRRLLKLKVFAMTTQEVPLHQGIQYVGLGFVWEGKQTQRKCFINEVENETYQRKGKVYQWARAYESAHQNHLATFLKSDLPFNPLRRLPDLGGKPWLHGLGDREKSIGLLESQRNGHVLVLGTTRVGKTRLLSILVNQDIRRKKAVIFLDPKGDLDILRDMYAACKVADRLADFKIVHVGFPSISARLNTLASYSDIADVATRITNAMDASGEGSQFKDFAWKYLNITAKCLMQLNEPINYRTISFYITRPEVLLLKYADAILPGKDDGYLSGVQDILDKNQMTQEESSRGHKAMNRSAAIKKYLKNFIESSVSSGDMKSLVDDVIVPLYDAAALDSTYYQKITASVGPVLDKINQSSARDIFSFEEDVPQPEVNLMEAIKRKEVIYIGLNSLVNREVSVALGKAIVSDLVSCAGRIYNANEKCEACLYCDEFSEIVQDEFVTLLNKAGGAGFQVIAACQTINDLGAAFSGNHDKAKMLEGNFQSQVFLRVKNKETAMVLVDQLNEVEVVTRMEGSSASDTPHGEEGIYFNTGNDVRISLKPTPMLHPNDLISLPKGHAFLFTNGGELYKVRAPLPKNDSLAPNDFVELIEIVNAHGVDNVPS
jgi:conjugative coupling factor TraD (TOL family)